MLKQADYQGKGFALQERQRQPQEQQQQQPMPPPKAAPSTLAAPRLGSVTSFIRLQLSARHLCSKPHERNRPTASSRSSSSSVQERATKKTQHSTRVADIEVRADDRRGRSNPNPENAAAER